MSLVKWMKRKSNPVFETTTKTIATEMAELVHRHCSTVKTEDINVLTARVTELTKQNCSTGKLKIGEQKHTGLFRSYKSVIIEVDDPEAPATHAIGRTKHGARIVKVNKVKMRQAAKKAEIYLKKKHSSKNDELTPALI